MTEPNKNAYEHANYHAKFLRCNIIDDEIANILDEIC